MKKSLFAGISVWLIATTILILLVFEPAEKPKKVEAVKQPVQTTAPTETVSGPWAPKNISFCGRLLFLEGEIREKLIEELEIEIKRYRSAGGLNSIKNNLWLSYIEKQLEKADIPPDLIWLPVIESSMRPTVTSHKGAGGYWQFMPTTASNYGLKITPYIDERFDPIKSTDAAIRHLNDLIREFDDWTASLAGWNMDPAALKEAMKQEKTINFYELKSIPKETQRFPFRLMATKLIFENPEKYEFSKTGWFPAGSYDNWQIIKIDLIVNTDSSIEKIVEETQAEYPDIKFIDFRRFNSHIIGNFLPRGNYTMYILKENSGTS